VEIKGGIAALCRMKVGHLLPYSAMLTLGIATQQLVLKMLDSTKMDIAMVAQKIIRIIGGLEIIGIDSIMAVFVVAVDGLSQPPAAMGQILHFTNSVLQTGVIIAGNFL